VRHPDTAERSRARRLELDDERAEQAIRYYGLNIPERCKEVLADCEEYLRLVEARLKDADDRAAKEALHVFTSRMGNRLRYRSRGFYFLALAMFLCYRQYRNYFPRRQDWVKNLVPSDAKNFFRDLVYEIDKSTAGFNVSSLNEIIDESLESERQEDGEEEQDRSAEERQSLRVQELEAKLEVTESTLQFIRRSLDDMTEHMQEQSVAAKNEAINNFFTSMNAQKYGRLLDSALEMSAKLRDLRREQFKMPVELMGMSILVKNLFSFIKDSGFETIKESGQVFAATADELAYASYTGEPFAGEERKSVQVVSPGWRRAGVIISRPVVGEPAGDMGEE